MSDAEFKYYHSLYIDVHFITYEIVKPLNLGLNHLIIHDQMGTCVFYILRKYNFIIIRFDLTHQVIKTSKKHYDSLYKCM